MIHLWNKYDSTDILWIKKGGEISQWFIEIDSSADWVKKDGETGFWIVKSGNSADWGND